MWSTGVPASGQSVCITAAGTYTVTLAQDTGGVVGAVTVGGAKGTQTLQLVDSCVSNSILRAASVGVAQHGALILTDGACANVAWLLLSGALTNAGAVSVLPGNGGGRAITASIVSTGTVDLSATVSVNPGSSSFDNKGPLTIGSGAAVTVYGAFVNDAKSVTVNGTGVLTVPTGGTYTQNAGTVGGTAAMPVVVDNGHVVYKGTGAGTVWAEGGSTVGGNLAAKQALVVASTCSEHAQVTAARAFTNAGTITLTNADSCQNNATLTISSGVLTNSGTLDAAAGAGGGVRQFQGGITNTGSITLEQSASQGTSGALIDNKGAIHIADGVVFDPSLGNLVDDAKGSIVVDGNGYVWMHGAGPHSGTYTQGAGTVSGTSTTPIYLDDANVVYTGAGASKVFAQGSDGITGNLAAGQSLTVESTCSEHATVTAAKSFTSAGSIVLTNSDTCPYNATLAVTSGTFTNSGTVDAAAGIGGSRYLQGNVTNTGTITVEQSLSDTIPGAVVDNKGAMHVLDGVQLNVTPGNLIDDAQGSLVVDGTGSVLINGNATYTQGAGTVGGTAANPVTVDDGHIAYTGAGAGKVLALGADGLIGNISAGQTLTIEDTCGEATAVYSGAFTNNGTVVLSDGDTCAYSASLVLSGAQLTNNGTLQVATAAGGTRDVQGTVVNSGTVSIEAGTALSVTVSYTQKGALSALRISVTDASTYGVLQVSGTAGLAGGVQVTGDPGFANSHGVELDVLTSGAATTGAFAKVSGGVVGGGWYYRPSTTANGAALTVTQALAQAVPSTAAAGTAVTLSGAGWPSLDTITVQFTDSASHTTTVATIKTAADGSFSSSVKVPAKAPSGAGSFTLTSSIAGVVVSVPFTVG
jgi:hypothetical protein